MYESPCKGTVPIVPLFPSSARKLQIGPRWIIQNGPKHRNYFPPKGRSNAKIKAPGPASAEVEQHKCKKD